MMCSSGSGEMAGVGADVVAIVQKPEYLRGRSPEQVSELLRQGLAHAGVEDVSEFGGEVDGCAWLVAQAGPGDVVGVMAHEQREQLDEWLIGHGGVPGRCGGPGSQGARGPYLSVDRPAPTRPGKVGANGNLKRFITAV